MPYFNNRRRSAVRILLAATEPNAHGWLSPKHFSINEDRENSNLDHDGAARISSTIGHGLLPTARVEQECTIGLLVSFCPRIRALVARMFHKLQLSSGSCQVMRSKIRCP